MNITHQAMFNQSEMPLVAQGQQAHTDGQAMSSNPYPAVCQASLRHHWLWDQGWLMKDSVLAYTKENQITPP